VLGTVNPVEEMVAYAHSKGVTVLVDGAQASSHIRLDMQRLDADFYVFSSHKMYGPTGVGVLYGKQQLLEEMPPYQGGGEMIKHVSFEKTTFADLPFKFEAGTPDFVDIAAFSKALEFINEKGIETIAEHENELLRQATEGLKQIHGVRIYGEAEHKSSVLSFLLGKAHPYDVGLFLDKMGIAVRTGHHCAQPLMERFDIPGTVRASFAIYNTAAEVDSFLDAMRRIAQILM
jgi:cysteine desulfurase/selenocysteine lyase